MAVYRGLAIEDLPGSSMDDAIGRTFVDRAFASTSYDRDLAGKFATWVSEDGKTPLVMRIEVTKGTPAGLMEAAARTRTGELISASHDMEGEILLARDSRFEIVGFHTETFTVYGEQQTIRVADVRLVP